MKELLRPKAPSPKGSGELALADYGGGLHEDRADVVVEAVDSVGVVVPVLQLEGALTISPGSALSAGILVVVGGDRADIDEGSPAWSGSGHLGDQPSSEAQCGQLVGRPWRRVY
ncbi:hypothetical protein BJ973_003054 [Actinoplanes tereljensis]|uniref:hypothetical protein n=1 Tax=Paractinoplanes tereljensis TaxID=571912 RepID=UPI001940CA67|nr:hypothetical protein [Actinoplanes tereljensis]